MRSAGFTRSVLARRVVNLAVDFKLVFTGVSADLFASAATSSTERVHVFLRIKNISNPTAAFFPFRPRREYFRESLGNFR